MEQVKHEFVNTIHIETSLIVYERKHIKSQRIYSIETVMTKLLDLGQVRARKHLIVYENTMNNQN